MTYTLRLYRQAKGAWSYTAINSVGGSSSMGTYRTKGGALYAARRGIRADQLSGPIEVYHWTGTRYMRKGGAR